MADDRRDYRSNYSNDRNGGDSRQNSDSNDRNDGRRRFSRRPMFRKKVCRFCTQNLKADYKNPDGLRRFVTDRGKILPRRITGTCAKHQRELAREIKRARVLAYLPFEKK